MDRKLYPGVPARRLIEEAQAWRVPGPSNRFSARELRRLINAVDELPPVGQYLIALALMLLVGAADALTDPLLAFSVFYLLPIGMLAWHRGWVAGRSAVIAATLVCLVGDLLAGPDYSSEAIRYWNAAARFAFYFVTAFVISDLRRAIDEQQRLARTDGLTEVANSRSFFELASHEVARQQRYLHPLSIAFVDCDNFKAVNDTFGHAAGDALLQKIAASIQGSLREVDTVARLGGDEFAVLLPESDAAAAATVVAKIRDVLGPAVADYEVTFSIGIVTYYVPPLNSEELIRAADEAMYEAKRHGKNGSRHRVVGGQLQEAVP